MLTPEEAQAAIQKINLGSHLKEQPQEVLARANAAARATPFDVLDARNKRLSMGIRSSGTVDLVIGDVPGTSHEDDTVSVLFNRNQLQLLLELVQAAIDTFAHLGQPSQPSQQNRSL